MQIYNLKYQIVMNEPEQIKTQEKNNKRDSKKRYKYCCRKCKHTQTGKKSCVCVVPMSQRRTNLTEIGCQTCGCKGCSIEDYVSRGEDPEYNPSKNQRSQQVQKAYCCKKCLKNGRQKECVCQLPKNKRKGKMPPGGCKVCNCMGCNPKNESDSQSSSPSRSQSSSLSVEMNSEQYNFHNIDKSLLGTTVRIDYNMIPSLLGMGIPQRTASYILGKPL